MTLGKKLNQEETEMSKKTCDIKPDTPNIKDFILNIASRYKDDIPIKDLKLTLDLNGTIIDNFELEKYIQKRIQSNIELTKNKITKNILSTINNI